ncbi:hypothetical protein [Devosia sp.]|uniref:hypothetical protein n=1 Tax=Devosia sp. TaxID=1871048 RepID=UPI0032669013
MGSSDEHSGFEDVGAPVVQAPSLETYTAIYQQVLAAYGYRCALTGAQFESIDRGVHPSLRVVAIWPREEGGPLHMGNYLPFCGDAANAFRLGHFIIDDDFQVVADLAVMEPDLAKRLRAQGQLLVPLDPPYRPDRALLAHHRTAVLRR